MSKTSMRRFYAYGRLTQIVILDKRGANQILQLLIFENLKPFEIGERSRISESGS